MKFINSVTYVKYVNMYEYLSIHPILNIIFLTKYDNEFYYTLPYNNNNKINLSYKPGESEDKISNVIDLTKNPSINFGMPIDETNFLEIVFNINDFNDLYDWIDENKHLKNTKNQVVMFQNIKNQEPESYLIDRILKLFWNKYKNDLDNNFDILIKINKLLIYIYFNENIHNDKILIITKNFIKNNFNNNNLNYINELKTFI